MTILGKSIVAILLASGVIGGAYYATNFMKNDVSKAKEDQSIKATSEEMNVEEVATVTPVDGKVVTEKDMDFNDLMKKEGSYECTVKQSVMGVDTQGKVYIKDGNVSATFSTSVQGKTIDTSVVTKDGYSYTWSSMMSQGIKTKMATTSPVKNNPQAPASASYLFDGKNIGSYSCTSTSVPASTFEVPSTVTFTESQ